MRLSIMHFPSLALADARSQYDLVLRAARIADEAGFEAVWIPERHFGDFGGAFPNPALLGAAVATATSSIGIRAGSVISPLHDVYEIVEAWSVVDNLSNGRAGISFGSGWNAADFVMRPERFAERRELVLAQLEQARALWCGEPLETDDGTAVILTPRPLQPELPTWLTSSGNVETFRAAGRLGAGVLTHLAGKNVFALRDAIGEYRGAFRPLAGRPTPSVVLMLHTYLADDAARARAHATPYLRAYLRSAVDLERSAARAGGSISGGKSLTPSQERVLSDAALDELMELSVERYLDSASLIGTGVTVERTLREIAEAGVDEVACLIDFGLPADDVLASLRRLAALAGVHA